MTLIPKPTDTCPVCPHEVGDHDGVGCTGDYVDAHGLDAPCPCPAAQDMPDRPLSRGVFWPKPEGV